MTEAAGSRTFFEAFEDKYLAQLDDDCFGVSCSFGGMTFRRYS